MTVFDDDQDMRSQDEDELLLTGRPVPGDGALGDLIDSLRTMAQEPAPAPTPRLAALLEAGLPPRVAAVPLPLLIGRTVRRQARAGGRWVAGLGIAGKVVLGAGVAMAGVAGAATIPAVPDVVQQPAQTVLTDVGHAFGGGVVSPSPSPSGTTTHPRDDDTRRSTLPGTSVEQPEATSGTDDLGPTETSTSSGGRDDSRSGSPRRSGTVGDGSTSAPGQGSSGEQGSSGGSSSGGQGSSGKGASDGSSTEQGSSTGGDAGTREQQPAPTRSPQASSSPRADAGTGAAPSDR